MVKNLPANAEEPDSIPGLGRSLWKRKWHPLQYSCLKNFKATVPGVAKWQTELTEHTHTHRGHQSKNSIVDIILNTGVSFAVHASVDIS